MTKVSTTRICAVCERTLLMGERAVRFSPDDGGEFVDVCPLCQDVALEARLAQGGCADDADADRRPAAAEAQPDRVPRPHPRRRRGALAQQEPILRRLSDGEIALLEAADLFNASAYRRTVGGIAKSLGEAKASIVPLSGTAGELAVTVAWDLSWYQYRVSPESAQPVRLERRGHELEELDGGFKDWNAQVEDEGRLVPEIARL